MNNSRDFFSLKDKTVLIAGASGKIGKEIALNLAHLGADIYVHYHRNYEIGEEIVNEINKIGRKAYLVQGNLKRESDVKRIFQTIKETTDKLDILINSIEIESKSLVEDDWDDVLETNMKTIFLCTKNSLNYLMKSRNGIIVNISTLNGFEANPSNISFSVSKSGVAAMTKVLAKELGGFGIRVNLVSHLPIICEESNDNEKETNKISIDNIIKKAPLQKRIDCTDIVDSVLFLCSDMSKFITGVNLIVDGGYTL